MKTDPREILMYYNPDSSRDRKTVAHAQSHSKHIKLYSHEQSDSSETSWEMILDALSMHPKELLNEDHPDYKDKISGKEFDEVGWLHVLQEYPHLIKAPIAMRGKKAILCLTPTDIYSL